MSKAAALCGDTLKDVSIRTRHVFAICDDGTEIPLTDEHLKSCFTDDARRYIKANLSKRK